MILSRKEKKLNLCNAFVIVELVLGIIIHFIPQPKYVQYAIIALACFFCISFAEKSKQYIFTQAALVCTLVADFFLICLDASNQLAGMIFFVGTQISYFLRIYFEEENLKIRKIHLIIRISASVLILLATCLVLSKSADAVALVSMVYFANLVLNTVFAFINFKNSPLLAIGLTFFVLCDIYIGFSNIGPYFTIPEGTLLYNIMHSSIISAWTFYVPSQILLAISLTKIKKRV